MIEAAAATPTPSTAAEPSAAAPSPPAATPEPGARRLSHVEKVERAIAAKVAAEKASPAAGTDKPAASTAGDPSAPAAAPAEKPSLDEKMARFREDRSARAKATDRAAKAEADLARFRGLDEVAAKGDPAELLRYFGKDPRALVEAEIIRTMKEGAAAPDPVAEQIAAELAPLRKELEQHRTEAQRREQAMAFERYVHQEVLPVVSDGEKFEALHFYHADDQGRVDLRRVASVVADARAKLYQKTGELLTPAEIAEWLDRDYEEMLTKGLEKAAKVKRFSSRFGAAPPAPPPQHGKEPRTLIGNARRAPEPPTSATPIERPRRLGHEEKKAAAIERARAALAR